MSPSEAEQQALCVYEYAKLTKDPSACELLLPSSYGWDCLRAAQATADACSFDYGKNVAWRLGDDVYDPWKNATIEECKNDKNLSAQGQKCCYIFQLEKDPEDDACSRFAGEEKFMNTCLAELATRKKNPTLCKEITDDNKRVICELRAKYAS